MIGAAVAIDFSPTVVRCHNKSPRRRQSRSALGIIISTSGISATRKDLTGAFRAVVGSGRAAGVAQVGTVQIFGREPLMAHGLMVPSLCERL